MYKEGSLAGGWQQGNTCQASPHLTGGRRIVGFAEPDSRGEIQFDIVDVGILIPGYRFDPCPDVWVE